MAWIEVHQSLPDHRKTLGLADALDVPQVTAVGIVVSLWLWSLDNAPEGELHGLTNHMIARGARWDGDADALVDGLTNAGFFDRGRTGKLSIHDWMDYAGRLITQRKQHAHRARTYRAHRARTVGASSAQYRTVQNTTVPDLERGNAQWVMDLQALPGWAERGEPHLEAFIKLMAKKGWTADQVERSAVGLAKVKEATLLGYSNLIAALRTRLNKGYDEREDGGSDGKSRRRNAGDQGEGQGGGGFVPSFAPGPYLP